MIILASILLGFMCSGFCLFFIFSVLNIKTFSEFIFKTEKVKLFLYTALFDIFVICILLIFSFVFELNIFYYIVGVLLVFLILKIKNEFFN